MRPQPTTRLGHLCLAVAPRFLCSLAAILNRNPTGEIRWRRLIGNVSPYDTWASPFQIPLQVQDDLVFFIERSFRAASALFGGGIFLLLTAFLVPYLASNSSSTYWMEFALHAPFTAIPIALLAIVVLLGTATRTVIADTSNSLVTVIYLIAGFRCRYEYPLSKVRITRHQLHRRFSPWRRGSVTRTIVIMHLGDQCIILTMQIDDSPIAPYLKELQRALNLPWRRGADIRM